MTALHAAWWEPTMTRPAVQPLPAAAASPHDSPASLPTIRDEELRGKTEASHTPMVKQPKLKTKKRRNFASVALRQAGLLT